MKVVSHMRHSLSGACVRPRLRVTEITLADVVCCMEDGGNTLGLNHSRVGGCGSGMHSWQT